SAEKGGASELHSPGIPPEPFMSRQGLLIAWVLSVVAAGSLGAFLGPRPTNAVAPSHPESRDGREDALEPMMASILARLEGIEERLMAIETREHRSPTPDTSATPTDGETGPLEDLIDRMKEDRKSTRLNYS